MWVYLNHTPLSYFMIWFYQILAMEQFISVYLLFCTLLTPAWLYNTSEPLLSMKLDQVATIPIYHLIINIYYLQHQPLSHQDVIADLNLRTTWTCSLDVNY